MSDNYQIYYKIVIKEQLPKIITWVEYEIIKKLLTRGGRWIEIWNELYDSFTIQKIIKLPWWHDYFELLQNESEYIKEKVKEFILTYEKEITRKVIINMIEKAKE